MLPWVFSSGAMVTLKVWAPDFIVIKYKQIEFWAVQKDRCVGRNFVVFRNSKCYTTVI